MKDISLTELDGKSGGMGQPMDSATSHSCGYRVRIVRSEQKQHNRTRSASRKLDYLAACGGHRSLLPGNDGLRLSRLGNFSRFHTARLRALR